MSDDAYHQTRFPFDERRQKMWSSLWRLYFSKLIPADACVVDLGAGHCGFINQATKVNRSPSVRIADSTGIELGELLEQASADVRTALGLERPTGR